MNMEKKKKFARKISYLKCWKQMTTKKMYKFIIYYYYFIIGSFVYKERSVVLVRERSVCYYLENKKGKCISGNMRNKIRMNTKSINRIQSVRDSRFV